MRLTFLLLLCCGISLATFRQQNNCYLQPIEVSKVIFDTADYGTLGIRNWETAINNYERFKARRDVLEQRIKDVENAKNEPRICGFIAPEMVLIKGGTFQMGSDDGENHEKPIHSATISTFYLGKYEITLAQFKEFIEDTKYKTDAENYGKGNIWAGESWETKEGINWQHDEEGNLRSNFNYPVVQVSWNDAIAYCHWLSQKTGKKYRLPTEAEWEYAAGNGSRHTKYSWGNDAPSVSRGGNVSDETHKKKFDFVTVFSEYTDNYVYAAPVGSFSANDFGVYDMAGNVSEWCSDYLYIYNTQINFQAIPVDSSRVVRGCNWGSNPDICRVTFRYSIIPSYNHYWLGFRVALSNE